MNDPIDLTQLSDAELDQLIVARQGRRLALQRAYEAAVKAKAIAQREGLEDKLDHELKMFEKELAQVDKVLNKLELRVNKLAAIRLELGDYEPDAERRGTT